MTDNNAPQSLPADSTGKLPIGFWWIAIGSILVLCGLAILYSVLPQLLDGTIMSQSHLPIRKGPLSIFFHRLSYFIGPLLPGLFAIGYGLSLRKKRRDSANPRDETIAISKPVIRNRSKVYSTSIFILVISEVWMTIWYAPKILAFFDSPSDELQMWHVVVYGLVTIAFAAGIIYFNYQLKKIQKETGKTEWSS